MPENALGHASLALRADLAKCPLDFEWRTGTFKFEISGRQFRDWRIWRDPRATEAARRYRIATPVLPGHPPHATPPILKGLASRATDRMLVIGREPSRASRVIGRTVERPASIDRSPFAPSLCHRSSPSCVVEGAARIDRSSDGPFPSRVSCDRPLTLSSVEPILSLQNDPLRPIPRKHDRGTRKGKTRPGPHARPDVT